MFSTTNLDFGADVSSIVIPIFLFVRNEHVSCLSLQENVVEEMRQKLRGPIELTPYYKPFGKDLDWADLPTPVK